MKRSGILLSLMCGYFIANAQTLQSITDNGASTTNTISSLNPNGFQVSGTLGNPAYLVIDQTVNSGGKRWRFGHTGVATGFGSFDILNITDNVAALSIASNGNVGIGTTEPENAEGWARALEVKGEANSKMLISSNQINTGVWSHNTGFYGAPAGGITGTASNHPFSIMTNKTTKMIVTSGGDVGIGTTTPREKLSVNGNIRAQEIKVEMANWPDYVFAKEYQLPTLQETEEYIRENGHLPGIPSAAEVKANGIYLGEMNGRLLRKIEELTLHLIEKDRQLNNERTINLSQEKRLMLLESKLNKVINK